MTELRASQHRPSPPSSFSNHEFFFWQRASQCAHVPRSPAAPRPSTWPRRPSTWPRRFRVRGACASPGPPRRAPVRCQWIVQYPRKLSGIIVRENDCQCVMVCTMGQVDQRGISRNGRGEIPHCMGESRLQPTVVGLRVVARANVLYCSSLVSARGRHSRPPSQPGLVVRSGCTGGVL